MLARITPLAKVKRLRQVVVCAASTALILCLAHHSIAAQSRPNIVFLFADDLGYGDLACYGATDAQTPNIDRLARQGARFTQHYSNGPECSPTRTALLTGRYQQRAFQVLSAHIGTGNVGRYDDAIRLADNHDLGLPPKLALLPRAVHDAGYRFALYGKWHLGYEAKFHPLNYGFDDFFGCLGGYVDYFTHRELSPLDVLYDRRRAVEREGYMTHLIAEKALGFLDHADEKPFFLYVPFTSPHFPFQGPGDSSRKTTAENLTKGTRAQYVELLEDLDAQVGRILDRLKQRGLAENTVVVFASDNGAMAPGRNLPLAGYKGTVYEGGIRVPLIVRWPGKIDPGSVCRQPCITFDLTSSFLNIAGGTVLQSQKLDGIDIIAHAAEKEEDFARTLFWRGRRGDRTERAVRHGDWKYRHRKLDDGSVEEGLFDLSGDPAEAHNLLETQADQTAQMRNLLAEWEKDVKAIR